MRRSLALLLLLSLALNLGLGAALLTRLWREHRVEAAIREGSEWAQSETLRPHREALRASLAGLRQAQREVAATLRRRPFDAHALEQAFLELEKARAEHARSSRRLLLELARSLDERGRERLAERLEGPRRHGRWREGRGRERPP